ncbi:MAG: aminotransferase class III-fold pyridoxal phosphate-dependent enzyme, partial [Acidaminococcales bacterium]|nr:aminotransferase class III-fold pyridoxal phosphate-dependent enzyme [Acidaminococcales bacterium]
VLLEPIQGEGGVNMPPAGYLAAARELCDKHGALLLFDEIQTGIGRTGKWFAFEHTGIRPDVMSIGKGLGGGFPIGAFLASERVARAFSAGDHGSTFGGSALACAAANAVLDIMERDGLVGNAAKMGRYLKEKLAALQEKHPQQIKDVRGQGLLVGAQLHGEGKPVVEACLSKGLILNCTAGKVLRFVPPLTVNEQEIDFAVTVLDEVLSSGNQEKE